MPYRVTDRCDRLAQIQHGVIARRQALDSGVPSGVLEGLLRTGRWQTLRRGVYSVFTGAPSREATLWAAVLSAGHGAALSHQTAAELFKIIDWSGSIIHLTIPEERRVDAAPDIVVHRSRNLDRAIHPTLLPPRTRVEETVLDVAASSANFDDVLHVVCAACQHRRTTSARIAEAMARRARLRWRAELTEALCDIGAGAHSVLEYRYVRRVERPHGLPAAARQAWVSAAGRNRYLDNLYDGYCLCVELDGQQAHPEHQRWNDQRRTNALAERGLITLRYGWTDVHSRPCETAAQIGAVLRTLGWPGPVRRCGPGCQAAPGS